MPDSLRWGAVGWNLIGWTLSGCAPTDEPTKHDLSPTSSTEDTAPTTDDSDIPDDSGTRAETLELQGTDATITGRTLDGDAPSRTLAALSGDSLTITIADFATFPVQILATITPPPGRALDLRLEGRTLLVVMESLTPDEGDLLVYDLDRLDDPPAASGLRLTMPHSVVVSGQHAFVASWQGISVVDVADPAAPTLVAEWLSPDPALEPDELAIADDRLYIGGIGGIAVVDVSDPTAPVTLSTAPYTSGVLHNVAVVPGALYSTDESDGGVFRVWDLADPDRPAPTTTTEPLVRPMIHALEISRGQLVGAFYEQGLRMWSLADPLVPTQSWVLDTCECAGQTSDLIEGATVLWAEDDVVATLDSPRGLFLLTWVPEP